MDQPLNDIANDFAVQTSRASRAITRGIEAELAVLHELNAWKRLEEFIFFGALYTVGAVTMSWYGQYWLAFAGGVLLMGIALNSLGIIIHEGLHGILAKHHHLNHLLSFLVGVPLLVSASAYQVTHTNHHYELGRKLDFGTYKQHVRNPMLIWVAYLLQLTIGAFVYIAFIPFLAFAAASRRARFFIILEYIAIVAVAVSVFMTVELTTILHYWFFPALVMNILTNVRGLASHALGDVENIYLSSRTVLGSKLVALLFLNENYHLEHHLFPGVPSYNLQKVHDLIWDRLPEAVYADSYIHFLQLFFSALWRNDLTPQGVVHPAQGRSG